MTTDVFSVSVEVYDPSGNIENNGVSYLLTIELTPSGTIQGTTTCQTVNGVCNFSNLKISTANNYVLRVFNAILTPATTTQFGITSLSLILTSNTSVTSVNFEITLTALLKENGIVYAKPYTVYLTESGGDKIYGYTQLATNSSSQLITFNIRFEVQGEKNIIATVQNSNQIPGSNGLLISSNVSTLIHPLTLQIDIDPTVTFM